MHDVKTPNLFSVHRVGRAHLVMEDVYYQHQSDLCQDQEQKDHKELHNRGKQLETDIMTKDICNFFPMSTSHHEQQAALLFQGSETTQEAGHHGDATGDQQQVGR